QAEFQDHYLQGRRASVGWKGLDSFCCKAWLREECIYCSCRECIPESRDTASPRDCGGCGSRPLAQFDNAEDLAVLKSHALLRALSRSNEIGRRNPATSSQGS